MTTPQPQMPAMAGYGVNDQDWSPLPWSWAAQRLSAARNYWVVTVSGSGRPAAMPVWGVWDDGECRFSFSCADSARKARNIAANPQVCVAPEDTVECVSVEGTAELITDAARQDEWIERYLLKYRPISPDLSGDFLRSSSMFEVTPDRAFGVIERENEFSTRATRWAF